MYIFIEHKDSDAYSVPNYQRPSYCLFVALFGDY